MPLNKLENFIKNAEGRILYVNPNDLDATDGIENQGNSLTKPFKTIQRALLESARFSYLRGDDNDITEKTTILLFPGEHLIDNRPGFSIRDTAGQATAVSPSGTQNFAPDVLSLTLDSNFDLTQEDNILYKFNSREGGVVVPRGTSIVGLDLRKTKIRPKYVPNPTDPNAKNSSIFKITGACYFWQFSIFDADESGLVYTDPINFSTFSQSKPTFSHHKLTCFEYADGVNIIDGYNLTDLDMYYSKISNAFNRASGREIDQKYPAEAGSFSKQRPEWEIVGAFAPDPISISSIISGDGATPGNQITVTTFEPHNLNSGTPVKIRGVNVSDFNVSTKVQTVIDERTFTYLLPFVRSNLPSGPAAGLSSASATVTIETDTVSGASPYIFNISLRSVWGMQGMHADGSKASGFRSMVVAQFTAISLQKDDRAFVEYNKESRKYNGITISTPSYGDALSSGSSSTNQQTIYHLSPSAVYREGWKTTHIKASNDSFIQIVSVFAIGFHNHFESLSGGDCSITNSNSNFGQNSLAANGFKSEAFSKDDKGFVTSIITPRSIVQTEKEVEWLQFDVANTLAVNQPNQLYLLGYTDRTIEPPIISQGFRIGSRLNERVYLREPSPSTTIHTAEILMTDSYVASSGGTTLTTGSSSSTKSYNVVEVSTTNPLRNSIYVFSSNHTLRNGEKIRIFSETGDLPENINPHEVYYAITDEKNSDRINIDGIQLAPNEIQLASSLTNANSRKPVYITSYGGDQLRIESRVSDKKAGEIGHPIQWNPNINQWFVNTNSNSEIFTYLQGSPANLEIPFFHRVEDGRSLDEKLYKIRYVIPKELENSRNPIPGFILQESGSTNVRQTSDFTISSLALDDYDFNRNTRFLSNLSFDSLSSVITAVSEKPHNLKVGHEVNILSVKSTTNINGVDNIGYNGKFIVSSIIDDKTFTYSNVDIFEVVHNPGTFTNDTSQRDINLPRFSVTDNKGNNFIYRVETISDYIENVQDGVYHLYVLNSSNAITDEFTNSKYSQKVTDLYPQLDRDNHVENPPAAKTFAKRSPIGEVVTNDLKRSITRESIDKFVDTFGKCNTITSVSDASTSAVLTLEKEHNLSGLVEYTTLNGGSGHTDGTYYNVKLFNDASPPASATWDGATATVSISGGVVISANIVEGGSGYTDGEQLYFDVSTIGGTPSATSANIVVNTAGISTAGQNYIQVTGIGTSSDGYYRLTDTTNKKSVSIAKTAGDPTPTSGQYIINLGQTVSINQTTHSSGITTFTTPYAHGLVSGNSFRVLDTSNNNIGDFIVDVVQSITEFTALTNVDLSTLGTGTPSLIMKHGFSANNASSDKAGENLGTRSISFYENEIMFLDENITSESEFEVRLANPSTLGLTKRFPLGSYIQIGNEIIRIISSTLTGASNNKITTIRGSLGTNIEEHANGSLIKKISLSPVELRRPSIIRASGHTFEYLGYGPGNYSTGLPQVQLKTLTELESFLSQSQETSCGTVVYTGMNNDGDFYIGNTKYSSSSGEQTSFDIPKPSITGEDPNRLSVIFDEVIVKERILVEGGTSNQILSQFEGPVTFNGEMRINNELFLNDTLRVLGVVDIRDQTQSTSCTTGALVIAGGVGIGGNVNICGDLTVEQDSWFEGNVQLYDSNFLRIGSGNDLTFTHDSSDSYIRENSSGNLIIENNSGNLVIDNTSGNVNIRSTQLSLRNGGGTEQIALFEQDSSVTLYYDGLEKIKTVSAGVEITGNITATGAGNFGGPITGESLTVTGNISGGSVSVSGQIIAGGDITAFASDIRLKENIRPIENALDKVISLRGFTYTFNEVGGSLGYDMNTSHAGVSAQEVSAVLPEAIAPAPLDNNYMAVKYDKLVPLLIEAIKELKQEIEDLKNSN